MASILHEFMRLVITAIPFLAAIAYPFIIPWESQVEVSTWGIFSWIFRFLEVLFEAYVCFVILSSLPKTIRLYLGTLRRFGWGEVVVRSPTYFKVLARSTVFSPWIALLDIVVIVLICAILSPFLGFRILIAAAGYGFQKGLLWILDFILNPTVLVLAASDSGGVALLKSIQRSLPDLKVMHFLNPKVDINARSIGSMRQRTGDWKDSVYSIFVHVPLVVMDTRSCSDCTLEEIIGAVSLSYKVVFVTGSDGSWPLMHVFATSCLQENDRRVVASTFEGLPLFLQFLTRNKHRLPTRSMPIMQRLQEFRSLHPTHQGIIESSIHNPKASRTLTKSTKVTIKPESQAAVMRSQFGDNPTLAMVLTKLVQVAETLNHFLPLPKEVPKDLVLEFEQLCVDLKRVASQDGDSANVDEILAEFARLQRRIDVLVPKLSNLDDAA